MGLEMMGYTKTTLKTLWIDPVDYQDTLEEAVSGLALRGMNVSLYAECGEQIHSQHIHALSASDLANI